MATNDFQIWAGATNANVLSQAAYTSLANLKTGVQSGIASSSQANKTWRQSSIMASMLGQFICDYTQQNATDDGTIATLESQFVQAIQATTRPRLTTGLNLYVNPSTGNDNNPATTPTTACQTIQGAWNALTRYDLNGHQAVINLAGGTYPTGLAVAGQLVGQTQPVVISGITNSPASVIVNSSSTQVNTFSAQQNASMIVQWMTINSSGTGQGGDCLAAQNGGLIGFGNVVFGPAVTNHIIAGQGGNVICTGSYQISGAAGSSHLATLPGGYIQYDANAGAAFTVTLTNSPGFSIFATCYGGYMVFYNTSWSGSANGQKFKVAFGGYINTNGQGANYFPGSTAGGSDPTYPGFYS